MPRKRGRPPLAAPPATAADTADETPARARAKEPRKTPHRTPQNPMEKAAEEVVYSVDRITGMRWSKGVRQYLVLWENYAEKDATWEPMENLVGCAAQIRSYEKAREAEDLKAKEDILQRRREKRDQAASEAAAQKAAAAAAITDLPDGDCDAAAAITIDVEELASKDCLKVHKGKRTAVWKAFDLTCTKPRCKLMKSGTRDVVCGECPSGGCRYHQLLGTSLVPP